MLLLLLHAGVRAGLLPADAALPGVGARCAGAVPAGVGCGCSLACLRGMHQHAKAVHATLMHMPCCLPAPAPPLLCVYAVVLQLLLRCGCARPQRAAQVGLQGRHGQRARRPALQWQWAGRQGAVSCSKLSRHWEKAISSAPCWCEAFVTPVLWLLRAACFRALARIGWWAEWTVCEDNMMAMQLQRRGYRGYFVNTRVAHGQVRRRTAGTTAFRHVLQARITVWMPLRRSCCIRCQRPSLTALSSAPASSRVTSPTPSAGTACAGTPRTRCCCASWATR